MGTRLNRTIVPGQARPPEVSTSAATPVMNENPFMASAQVKRRGWRVGLSMPDEDDIVLFALPAIGRT